MTRPTDAELAALLRELGDALRRESVSLSGYVHPLADRARAMADQLTGEP